MLRSPRRSTRVIAHLSDVHLSATPDRLAGVVDARANLARALAVLTTWNVEADAWLFSGDLSDDGSPESYAALRDLVEPAAAARGVQVWWGNGNHDDLPALRAGLLDASGSGPFDWVAWLGALRVVHVDTSVPGVPWGRVSDASLAWLAAELATPASEGTIVVAHHAPLPQPQDAAALWPLTNASALGEVVRGTDVRLILSGHFHQPSHGTLAGVPVSVAPALAYGQDLTRGRTLRGQDAQQGFSLVELYDDTAVVTMVGLTAGNGVGSEITPATVVDRLRDQGVS